MTFGGISGAYSNPAVTIADSVEKGISRREVPAYIIGQIIGAFTLARSMNDAFAGIRPADTPGFIAAQFAER